MRQRRSRRRPDPATASASLPRRRHFRVRSLLLVVVLVPTLGMVALAATSASRALTTRDTSLRVQAEADTLAEIINARTAIAGEETQSAVVSIASDLGVSVDELSELYGVDYRAQIESARGAVDADSTIQTLPELSDGRLGLAELRTRLDAGAATFEEVLAVFDTLALELDEIWRSRVGVLRGQLLSAEFDGLVHRRADAVVATFEAQRWGHFEVSLAIKMLQDGPTDETLAEYLEASSRHRVATEAFSGLLGPRALGAWNEGETDPAVQRFDRTLEDLEVGFLRGATSPLASDPVAFGDAFIDGPAWADRLSVTAREAGADLREEAADQESEAASAFRREVGFAVFLTIFSLACAVLIARSVSRPIRRLEEAAHQVHQGHFDLDPIETRGPRELADTAAAFNDMATTLASVESHAVALADDPDASLLDEQLPGRTGRALQVALNRLRASIKGAEEHRRELEIAATRDNLTGLLNRTAAFVMIERELARATRIEGRVMALFIDLDGFKRVNDEHGHAAGDDALRMTADALRASTRQSDITARLGGDEFLVAGVVDELEEVETLAERIRRAVAGADLAGPDGPIRLTCSIGMAVDAPDVTTAEALIRRADSALYRAKRTGRDQALWYEAADASETTR